MKSLVFEDLFEKYDNEEFPYNYQEIVVKLFEKASMQKEIKEIYTTTKPISKI